MERILLYVHFNKYGQVSDHVYYQLERIKPLFSRILFISNSPLDMEARQKLQGELGISDLLERENRGFDFAAWRAGMEFLGFESLKDFQSLTLMNDTCFGPLWSLEEIYQEFENDSQVDFWGMTNFRQTKYFPEHLQSYFVSFKQRVLRDGAFENFWSQIESFQDVQEVIDRYETQFTAYFQKRGYRYKAVFDTRQTAAEGLLHPDFSYYRPQHILDQHLPLLKVKAVQGHPFLAPYLLQRIAKDSAYPPGLIKKHLFAYDRPDARCLWEDKSLVRSDVVFEGAEKVAVHIHVTDMTVFDRYRTSLFSLPFQADYLLTAASPTILSQLEKTIPAWPKAVQLLATSQTNPLLAMAEQQEILKNYDFVGHFSTHPLVEDSPEADTQMREDLFQTMLTYASTSLKKLAEEPRLGLVIPDLPRAVRYGQIQSQPDPAELQQLWEVLASEKLLDFDQVTGLSRVYGGFLWFRYRALETLFSLGSGQMPDLASQQVSSVLETLLLYLAWDCHYDFKVMSPSLLPAFLDDQRRLAELRKLKAGQLNQKGLLTKIRGRLAALLQFK